MAKLIKIFGIGGKKNPPHPPKPDYNSQKSNSVQNLLETGRFHTTDRTCRSSLCTTSGSNFATFDRAAHINRDSSRNYRFSQPTVSTSVTSSKQKEYNSHSNPPSGESSPNKEHLNCTLGSSDTLGDKDLVNSESKGDNKSSDNPTPPRLLDEYSDPFDLKKQIAENPELLGTNAPAEEDLPSVSDDDYSVPFEIKSMRDKKLREKEKQSKQSAARYENSKFEEVGAVGGNNSKQRNPKDIRPKEEYDDPWEWSMSHSIIFKEGEEPAVPPGCVKVCPDESQRKVTKTHINNDGDDSVHDYENSTSKRHDYVNTHIAPPAHPTENKGGSESAAILSRVTCNNSDQNSEKQLRNDMTDPSAAQSGDTGAIGGARPKEPTHVLPPTGTSSFNRRLGNYEEPWDLTFTQERLEECFKAKISTSDDMETETNEEKGNRAPAAKDHQPVNLPPDTRPQEGYEKPWDWKPDRKDDRLQEGYEKPWDWKPHQKDDRPMEEYDQPWDQKQAQLQQNIMKAKSAKEIKGCASNLKESQQQQQPQKQMGSKTPQHQPQQLQDVRPKSENKHSTSPKMVDSRPMEEYDMPWDQKTKKQAVSRSSSESSQQPQYKVEPAVLASPQHMQRASPSHKPQAYRASAPTPGTRNSAMVGERIDPKIPLTKQGWYHGAISRFDAERLLRVHKEGSYLVRMSESNKQDFSLSLKSARGFMHMKIVSKNGKFILGQFSQPFTSIPLMINHYSIQKLPIKGAEHMSLLHPIINELL